MSFCLFNGARALVHWPPGIYSVKIRDQKTAVRPTWPSLNCYVVAWCALLRSTQIHAFGNCRFYPTASIYLIFCLVFPILSSLWLRCHYLVLSPVCFLIMHWIGNVRSKGIITPVPLTVRVSNLFFNQ